MSFDADLYDLDRNFDRSELKKLIESVRTILGSEGIGTGVWSIEPWSFSLSFSTGRPDMSEMLYKIHEIPHVLGVSMRFDMSGKVPLIVVILRQDWFVKDEEKNKSKSRKHPEQEGGPLA